MPRYAYVNGRYVRHAEAAVHIEDRGYQFADAVYEVVTVLGGRLVDEDGHLERLGRSLGELGMAWPMARRPLSLVMRELVRRNRLRDGIVYLQIGRGVAPREFRFPKGVAPTLVMTTRRADLDPPQAAEGVAVITIPDIRWRRRDIKTVMLLAQVLGKQQAAEAGAYEAWQVEDGLVTEGTSSNAWIVTAEGRLVTRAPTHAILNGVTRRSLLRLAEAHGLTVEERAFTVAEALAAREAFISSATTFALAVVRIDGQPVGDGRPGPFTQRLRAAYRAYAEGAGAGPAVPALR